MSRLEKIEGVLEKLRAHKKENAPYYELRIISFWLNEYELDLVEHGKSTMQKSGTMDDIASIMCENPEIPAFVNMMWNDEWCHLFFQKQQSEQCIPGVAEMSKEQDLKDKPYLKWLYVPECEHYRNAIESMPQNFILKGEYFNAGNTDETN
ncbi:MAG: hypothetical protein ACI39H_04290 [Lachnospiraceae bacterium]